MAAGACTNSASGGAGGQRLAGIRLTCERGHSWLRTVLQLEADVRSGRKVDPRCPTCGQPAVDAIAELQAPPGGRGGPRLPTPGRTPHPPT